MVDNYRLRLLIDSDVANAPPATDQTVLTWLETEDTFYDDISWSDFAQWAATYNAILRLENAKASGGTDAIKGAAAVALVVLNAGQSLSLSSEAVRGLVSNLVPFAFSGAERDALLAYSKGVVSRWDRGGFPEIDTTSKLSHIAEARTL
jgi:hypothetical protein